MVTLKGEILEKAICKTHVIYLWLTYDGYLKGGNPGKKRAAFPSYWLLQNWDKKRPGGKGEILEKIRKNQEKVRKNQEKVRKQREKGRKQKEKVRKTKEILRNKHQLKETMKKL